ncbi:MAG: nuclear transport factor 2 family protein [Nevskia sp.]|nr:nuclear transport factor 2 family protein [Nevskia sp.]
MPIDAATPVNARQRRLQEVLRRWEDGYNAGIGFVDECYWPEASAYFPGGEVHGREQFLKLEDAILKAAPSRRIRVDRIHFSGEDLAVVEAVVLDTTRPNFLSPFCAVLTFRGERIIQDRTYMDSARWPGAQGAAGIATKGGLGRAAGSTIAG